MYYSGTVGSSALRATCKSVSIASQIALLHLPDEKERPKIVLICISKRSTGKENGTSKVIERDQTGQFRTVTDTDWRLLVAHMQN